MAGLSLMATPRGFMKTFAPKTFEVAAISVGELFQDTVKIAMVAPDVVRVLRSAGDSVYVSQQIKDDVYK